MHFLLFPSSFISLKSVGTEKITMLHSFLAILTLFRLGGGGGGAPPYRFFPCCDETACSRLMKLSDF